ncbi:ATP-dependent serine protease [Dysgonomonas sp. Marseille-P4677]|uniref:ATP-dependent serine protease n=1 Tax=Dysgonomonas sp. Marseille-P4677 TaxID=2364790 RepID=UPI0019116C5E|nr:ATP-dependent serine protease [Dysgonomonas sp. Marseille-P4677]MBK5719765.1 ATP-dependent serine protease [Dysgonomonas sp. Marseille-P4677]
MAKKATRQRATSITNFLSMTFDVIEFTGEWLLAFGRPEKGGIWYVGGRPTNGKTSFVVQLIKALALLGMRVRFYNFEEQQSRTMQDTIRRVGLEEVAKNIVMINSLIGYKELKEEITNTRNDVIVIDTIQKSGISAKQVEELRELFPNKLIIFVCHVLPNGLPDKQPATQVYREASLKIFCDRHRAISQGRYFGELGYFNIWKEKADEYWAVVE